MQVYVINLDRAPERLAYMDKTLTLMGMEYLRVSAVDGSTLSQTQCRDIQRPSEKFYPTFPI